MSFIGLLRTENLKRGKKEIEEKVSGVGVPTPPLRATPDRARARGCQPFHARGDTRKIAEHVYDEDVFQCQICFVLSDIYTTCPNTHRYADKVLVLVYINK